MGIAARRVNAQSGEDEMTDYAIFELGDVVLQSAATLRGAKLTYETFGALNARCPPRPVTHRRPMIAAGSKGRREAARNHDQPLPSHHTCSGKEQVALERAARAIELQFDYYGPFGFGAVVARLDEPMSDLNKKVTAQMLRERKIAIHGSKQYVIDKIMKMRKECGYDDFCFLGWFELGGF
jgi:hypothetical protein